MWHEPLETRTIRERKTASTQPSVSVFLSGSAMILLGFLFGRPMLHWMGTPADVIDKASLYLMIIFIGMPSNMAYNFGSAILRAMGDTKRPLFIFCLLQEC